MNEQELWDYISKKEVKKSAPKKEIKANPNSELYNKEFHEWVKEQKNYKKGKLYED